MKAKKHLVSSLYLFKSLKVKWVVLKLNAWSTEKLSHIRNDYWIFFITEYFEVVYGLFMESYFLISFEK